MAIALKALNLPQVAPDNRSVILIYNLCSGAMEIIHTHERRITCMDWGTNEIILFGAHYIPEPLFMIKSNGDSLISIPKPFNLVASGLGWASDFQSIYFSSQSTLSEIGLSGQVLQADAGFECNDFALLENHQLGFCNQFEVGVYDPNSGTTESLNSIGLLNNQSIAYDSTSNSLFTAMDTTCFLSDLETGQVSTLTTGYQGNRWMHGAATSSTSYLAYIATIHELDSSTQTVHYYRTEIRFINPDGSDERRLILDFD